MTRMWTEKAVPTHEAVQRTLAAAAAEAGRLGCNVNIAVFDSGGNLSGFLRMPDAFLPSIEIAIDKARTAAGFNLSTAGLVKALENDPPHVRDGILGHPGVTGVPGGIPLQVDGKALGGIGVSGASAEQDETIARAGAAALAATI